MGGNRVGVQEISLQGETLAGGSFEMPVGRKQGVQWRPFLKCLMKCFEVGTMRKMMPIVVFFVALLSAVPGLYRDLLEVQSV